MKNRRFAAFTRRVSNRLAALSPSAGRPVRDSVPLLGSWDIPKDGDAVPPGWVTVSGWTIPVEGVADINLRILMDGRVVGWIKPQRPRPDVVAVHGDRAALSGWSFDLYVDPSNSGAEIEVVANWSEGHMSFGKREIQVSSSAITTSGDLMTAGHLDTPISGEMITGSVLNVSGWALIDGRPADKIEIYLDRRQLEPARRCVPRPDLIGTSQSVRWQSAGFSAVIPLRGVSPGSNALLEVRAVNSDGKVWRPPPVSVTRVDPYVPPLSRFATAAGAGESVGRRRVCVFAHSLAIGGGELYLQELLYRLVELDFADFIVVCGKDGPLRAGLESVGVEVHIVAMPIDRRRHSDRVNRTRDLLDAWRCDVVLVNTLGETSRVEGAISIGLPVVWVIHESFDLDVFQYISTGSATGPQKFLTNN
ncbi:MAG: hypothetical protein WA988_11745 [Candidatus Nanopelagicales bacterium]